MSERATPPAATEQLASRAGVTAPAADFLERVGLAVGATRRRLRLAHALGAVVLRGPILAVGFGASLGLARWLVPELRTAVLAACAACTLALFVRAYRGGPGTRSAARALDRAHALPDRVLSSLECKHKLAQGEDLGAYWSLALTDFQTTTPLLEPTRAAPFAVPRGAGLALASFLAVGVMAFWRPMGAPPAQPNAPPVTAHSASRVALLSPEEQALLEEQALELNGRMTSDAGREAARELNRVTLELLKQGDREEAFRRLHELEGALSAQAQLDPALQEALAARGQALERSQLSRAAGQALSRGLVRDAADSLRRLAERLAAGSQGLGKKELDDLRAALEEARKAAQAERSAAQAEQKAGDSERQRLEASERRLREKRDKEGGLNPAETSELERTERELKRLERTRAERQEALSALDEELAAAAQALAEERRKSGDFSQEAAEHLERAADEIKETAQKQLSDEEKTQLLERLRQLAEQLRQRREEGGPAEEARRNFERRASGEEEAGPGGAGKPSPGAPGSGSVELPVPTPSSRPGAPGSAEAGATPGDQPGKEPGTQHDENLTGEPTSGAAGTGKDVSAVGQEAGSGPTASETIQTAAREGFARGGYETLYQQYRTASEEAMTQETIPPGYRRQIERYFQLIRPREKKAGP